MKLFLSLFLALFSLISYSQTQFEKINWTQFVSTAGLTDYENKVVFDANNNGYWMINNHNLQKFNQRNGKNISTLNFNISGLIDVKKFQVLANGSVFILGERADSTGEKEIILAYYDTAQNLVWHRTKKGNSSRNDLAVDMVVKDSAVYVCGVTDLTSSININCKVWTAKFDFSGNQIWQSVFNGAYSRRDLVKAMVVNHLNEVFITGSTVDYNDGLHGLATVRFLIKYDSIGTQVWKKESLPHNAGMGPPPFYSPVYHNDDEGFLLAVDSTHVFLVEQLYSGYVPSSHNYYMGALDDSYFNRIRKFNFNGASNGQIDFSPSTSLVYKKYIQELILDEEHYYYTLSTNGLRGTSSNYQLFKRNKNGSLVYSKSYSTYDWIDMTFSNNEFYIARAILPSTPLPTSLSVSKLDSAGNTLWNFNGSGINDDPHIALDQSGDPYILTESRRLRKLCTSLPTLSILNNDTNICVGDTIQVLASSNAQYFQWNTSNGLSDSSLLNPKIYPLVSKSFILKAEFLNGCKRRDTISILTNGSENYYSICSSDSVVISNNVYKNAGTYWDTITRTGLCDSIIVSHVSINNSNDTNHVAICSQDSLLFNGRYYTSTGFYSDTLSNSFGCDSIINLDLTVLTTNTTSSSISSCNSYNWSQTGITYIQSGLYYDTIVSINGCDSILQINLTIDTINDSVSQNGFTLTAIETGASYQWLDCSLGYSLISGATSSSFTSNTNGNYAVAISKNSCTDTSKCIQVLGVGLKAYENDMEGTRVFPNPTSGIVQVEFPSSTSTYEVIIKAITGQEVSRFVQQTNSLNLEIKAPAGIYFIQVLNNQNGNQEIIKLIKH